MGTIVGLAHDFVGTNNVNLLVPQGQFGTRLQGGRDAASPRYIFTRLAPLARHLFNEADDRLLAYQFDEGQAIEPAWYAPILPTVLVNGAEGIGTGWSTSVPNYSPRDLAANLKRMLDGGEPEPMTPWCALFCVGLFIYYLLIIYYSAALAPLPAALTSPLPRARSLDPKPLTRLPTAAHPPPLPPHRYRGFNGTIVEEERRGKKALGGRSYVVTGTIRQVDDTTLEISELPIRKWTQDYKEFLEELVKPEDKAAAPFITDYREHHTDTSVRFVVTLPEARMRELGLSVASVPPQSRGRVGGRVEIAGAQCPWIPKGVPFVSMRRESEAIANWSRRRWIMAILGCAIPTAASTRPADSAS